MSNEGLIRELQKLKLAIAIDKYLIKNECYQFRPVKIDGIYCYTIIHKNPKIINFEAVNISCEIKNENEDGLKEQYSLYHKKYHTIGDAVEMIEKIASTYKIYGGNLCAPNIHEMQKLEEVVLPYNEDQNCCVCFENTTGVTVCDHHICLKCRETCIIKKKTDCPMCRKKNILRIYKCETGIINNNDCSDLKEAYRQQRNCGNMNLSYDSEDVNIDEERDEESDDEIDEESDEEIVEEISYIIDRVGIREIPGVVEADEPSLFVSETFSTIDEFNLNLETLYEEYEIDLRSALL